jgi:hypothetical protein
MSCVTASNCPLYADVILIAAQDIFPDKLQAATLVASNVNVSLDDNAPSDQLPTLLPSLSTAAFQVLTAITEAPL